VKGISATRWRSWMGEATGSLCGWPY
jgi:hypothetical protein